MFPSSDPAIPYTILTEDETGQDTMPNASDAMDCESRHSDSPYSPVIKMSQTYTATPTKVSRGSDRPLDAAVETTFELFNEYVPLPSPTRSSKAASYQQLSPVARPSYAQPIRSQGRTSQESTPDIARDDYYHASDISIRRSASSTEAELFSDVDEEDLDDSGFEPTETADLPLHASGALNAGEPAVGSSSESEQREPNIYDSEADGDAREDRSELDGQVHQDRYRTISYESYPNANSPTESQLIDEGFEFHNRLPEHRQAGHFENEAFREALRDISPHLPRKQQWYAWRKVMEMLDNQQPEIDDLFDDSDLPNDFSLGSLAEHNFGSCHCGGDATKCSCAPGKCSCNACPRGSKGEQHSNFGQDTAEEEDDQDVPMVIGHTPITPMFPELRRSDRSIAPRLPEVDNVLPGLGFLDQTESCTGPASAPATSALRESDSRCGENCQCPVAQCRCDKSAETDAAVVPPGTTVDQLFEDPFKRPTAFSHPQDAWSDAATVSQSTAHCDFREPRGAEPHFPQIATQLSFPTVFSPNDAPTPSQDPRSPDSHAPAPATPMSHPISRPDTPRPQGTTYEYGIRQSVEPELLSPLSHRQSTPAYENRSLSPSPVSQSTPSDTSMHDATPTQHPMPAIYNRETSVLPDAPPVATEASSQPESPPELTVPFPAIPGPHAPEQLSQYAHIPPPPIPVSPTLKPRKQRMTSTSAASSGRRNVKSAVYGSKITKAQPKLRNVTRKATGKKVKAAVDRIEDSVRKGDENDELQKQRVSSRGSVRSCDPEEVLQKDGSPPRRSTRVRQRAATPPVGYSVAST